MHLSYHGRLARAQCCKIEKTQFLYYHAVRTGETPVIR